MTLDLYVDGAFRSKLGGRIAGAWRIIAEDGDILSQGDVALDETTAVGRKIIAAQPPIDSVSAELVAILVGLEAVPDGSDVEILSDSEAAIDILDGKIGRRSKRHLPLAEFVLDETSRLGKISIAHVSGSIHHAAAHDLAALAVEKRRRTP
jgi:ribonuclease HI